MIDYNSNICLLLILKAPISSFQLPNDMENYMQYHLMGSVSQIRMKPGCVPSKFECQKVDKTDISHTIEKPFDHEKKKKINRKECNKKRINQEKIVYEEVLPSTAGRYIFSKILFMI